MEKRDLKVGSGTGSEKVKVQRSKFILTLSWRMTVPAGLFSASVAS